jgi:hypothetical protein
MNKFLLILSSLLLLSCQEQGAFLKKGKKVKSGEEISATLNSSFDASNFQPSSSAPADVSVNDSSVLPLDAGGDSSGTPYSEAPEVGEVEAPEAASTNVAVEYERADVVPIDPVVVTIPGSDMNAVTEDPLALGSSPSNSSASLNLAPSSPAPEQAAPVAAEAPPVAAAESTAGFYGPAKNTLIIGDSHSSKMGDLGPGLVELFAKEGQTDLYSIGGSTIDHWLGDVNGTEKKSLLEKLGGSVGSSQNPGLEWDKGTAQSYADWNLLKLLEKHETDRLVLELGTNHSPETLEAKYIELITKTCQRVSEFFVILPPVQASKDFSRVNKSIEQKLMGFNSQAPASCPALKITVSNAWDETKYVALSSGKLEEGMHDQYHLWKKPAENAWLEKVTNSYHNDPAPKTAAAPTDEDAVLAALGLSEAIAQAGTIAEVKCPIQE